MSQFVKHVWGRLHKQNKNFLCAIVGPTGSGKSYSGLRLAEQVDKRFTIDQCVFTPKEFMDLLNSGKLKRGSVILFDEAGVAVNSRNFQSTTNKLMHFVNQTFRSNNYCVIYTMPDFCFLDLGIRKLVHVILETKKIDYKRELVWTRPLFVENNPQTGRIYMKYPRYRYPSNPRLMQVITRMSFHKPSENLIEAYEAKKEDFNKTLQLDVQSTFNMADTPKVDTREQAQADVQEVLDAILANKKKYLTPRGKLNKGKVSVDFRVGWRKLDRISGLLPSSHPHTIHLINQKHHTSSKNNRPPEAK